MARARERAHRLDALRRERLQQIFAGLDRPWRCHMGRGRSRGRGRGRGRGRRHCWSRLHGEHVGRDSRRRGGEGLQQVCGRRCRSHGGGSSCGGGNGSGSGRCARRVPRVSLRGQLCAGPLHGGQLGLFGLVSGCRSLPIDFRSEKPRHTREIRVTSWTQNKDRLKNKDQSRSSWCMLGVCSMWLWYD